MIDKNSLNEFHKILNKIQCDEFSDTSTYEEIQKNTVFNDLLFKITHLISGDDNDISEEDAFNMLINGYIKLLSIIEIKEIYNFSFKSYNKSHSVTVNDIDYDFDCYLANKSITEYLAQIDLIIDALNFDNTDNTLELILKRIEELIRLHIS